MINSTILGGVPVKKRGPEFFEKLGCPANTGGVFDEDNRVFYVTPEVYEMIERGPDHART